MGRDRVKCDPTNESHSRFQSRKFKIKKKGFFKYSKNLGIVLSILITDINYLGGVFIHLFYHT